MYRRFTYKNGLIRFTAISLISFFQLEVKMRFMYLPNENNTKFCLAEIDE